MTLKERAEKYARDKGGDCVHIPGGVGECIYVFAGCDIEKAYMTAFRDAIALAAEKAETFPTTDEFDRLDPCCYCDGVAKRIRALAEPETPPGACL